jgi:hypothetical protein
LEAFFYGRKINDRLLFSEFSIIPRVSRSEHLKRGRKMAFPGWDHLLVHCTEGSVCTNESLHGIFSFIGRYDQLVPGAKHIDEHFAFMQLKPSLHRCSCQGMIKIQTLHYPEIIFLVMAINLLPESQLQIRNRQGWYIEVHPQVSQQLRSPNAQATPTQLVAWENGLFDDDGMAGQLRGLLLKMQPGGNPCRARPNNHDRTLQ